MGRLDCEWKRTIKDAQGFERVVRCNRCGNCRVIRQLGWTLRLCLEQRSTGAATFVTTTYEEAQRPGFLRYSDMQSCLRRLRKSFQKPVRFFCCGQYGTKYGREHWHTIFYGVSPVEMAGLFRTSLSAIPGQDPQALAVSPTALWPHGSTHIAPFHLNRAKYVSKYVLRTGDRREAENVVRMSLRPGIGLDEIERIGVYLATEKPVWDRVPGWWRVGTSYLPLDRMARQRLCAGFEGAGGVIKHKSQERLPAHYEARVYALCGDIVRGSPVNLERAEKLEAERTVF